MSMYSEMGDAFKWMYYSIVGLLCTLAPLGLWKLWEICAWVLRHVTWQ